MAETIFSRVRRIISASIEDTVDAMERAGGTSVMREAIREVDRATDEVRAEHEAVTTRRLQAQRQQRAFRERLAGLDEKARFALGAGRDDLAEAAVSRQIDFEAQAKSLDSVQVEAAAEAQRLEACLTALQSRKAVMEDALANFEMAQRDAKHSDATAGSEGKRCDRDNERRVARAEAAFDRAMTGAGGVAGVTKADAQAVAKVAELDAMQRSAAIAQRLAAMRATQTAA